MRRRRRVPDPTAATAATGTASPEGPRRSRHYRRCRDTATSTSLNNATPGSELGQPCCMLYMPPENPASLEAEWLLILKWQKGIVSAHQARRLGMTSGEIRWKVKSAKWQAMYRGVYATFSGDLPWEARLWAAVLSIGDSAALSHESAAELHGFGKGSVDPVHVAVPLVSDPARWSGLRGVIVHRTRHWQVEPQPYWNLPRTPAAETVLDLVAAAPTLDDAYAWLSRAVTRRTVTPGLHRRCPQVSKEIRQASLVGRCGDRRARRHSLPAGASLGLGRRASPWLASGYSPG